MTRWRDGKMMLRWMAAAYLETEKQFRRIMGYRSLWVLESALRKEGEVTKETDQPEGCGLQSGWYTRY